MSTAVADELIETNPCRVRGGANVKKAREIRPASLAELDVLVTAIPARFQCLAHLGAWCSLRIGEICELRRGRC